jgi:WD40 repeat protein
LLSSASNASAVVLSLLRNPLRRDSKLTQLAEPCGLHRTFLGSVERPFGGQVKMRVKGRTGSRVYSVSFSPDGKRIVWGSGEFNNTGKVKVWDAQTGQEVRILQGHTSWARSVAFAPDSKRIASGS